MAERKVTNNSIFLFLGDDATTLDTVVCLTSIKDDYKLDEVESGTFCGSEKTPGDITGSVSAEGQHLLDPDSGKISGKGLWDIFTSKATKYFKIGPAVPVEGDVITEGTCFISGLGDSYAYNTQSTFSLTLSVKGTPTKESFVSVTGLSIAPATVTLAAAATQQITPTFTPASPSNTGITYTTSNAAKATVSAGGLITAVATGSATITATSNDGAFTDTVVVTIS